MAGGVSVQKHALAAGIQVCKLSIHELSEAARRLKRDYQSAGQGWRDEKYAQLGGIVEECCSSLTDPIEDLKDCQESLEKLLQAVTEYEDENF